MSATSWTSSCSPSTATPSSSSATGRTRAAPSRGGRPSEANRILNCHDGERSTWLAFTDEEREALATHDYAAAVRARRAPVPHADPVHRACSSATTSRWGSRTSTAPASAHLHCPTRTSRPEPCAHAMADHGPRPAPRVLDRHARCPGRAGPGRRHRGADHAAGRALRVGTSYFGPPRLRTCPGCRRWGWCAGRPVGRRVWFPTSAGMAPGDGGMAELAGPTPRGWPSSRPTCPTRRSPRSACRRSPRGWRFTWRGALRPGERCSCSAREAWWGRWPSRPPACSVPPASSRRPARPRRRNGQRACGADAVVDR